jgi:RNA polymerase sigma factor (sigma-70 family)
VSTDNSIIRRSLDHPAAFGELFERHGAAIYRYVARRVGRDVADDVMSETFLIAFAKRKRFDHSRDNARPWLYGIASNLVSRHFAEEIRQLKAIAAAPHEQFSTDAFETVAQRIDAVSHVAELGKAIASLSRADRETLLLYAWAGLDYEGVAAATGVSVGTVKSRLNRARNKLRHAILPRDTTMTGTISAPRDREDLSHGRTDTAPKRA